MAILTSRVIIVKSRHAFRNHFDFSSSRFIQIIITCNLNIIQLEVLLKDGPGTPHFNTPKWAIYRNIERVLSIIFQESK